MIDIKNKIILLDDQSQLGQKELDALIEANAADSRMLLNQALQQQAGAHSKLEQKILERKRRRFATERLGDEISGHVDVTEFGGVHTSLGAMKHRHALKDATIRLLEAREQVAMMREHVAFKKGVRGVKEERDARIALEEQEEVARGMAILEAQQTSARRKSELELEAEIERARLQAVSEAHLEVEMEG